MASQWYNGGIPQGGPAHAAAGNSQMMMMASLMLCCCVVVSAGAGFMLLKPGAAPPAPEPPVEDSGEDTGGGGSGDFDGATMFLVGSLAMSVEGSCGSSKIQFKTPSNSKTAWKVRKAGTTADGTDYYILESDFKTFVQACDKKFLTAPIGCRSGPYLDRSMSSPRQYWILEGDKSNVSLRNLACKMSRYPNQFLQQSGQKGSQKPNFTTRGGTLFQMEAPYTG